MSTPIRIVPAQSAQQAALEALMRRASEVWPAYREALRAHPEVFAVDPAQIAAGHVRIAAAPGSDEPLGFSIALPHAGDLGWELDGLFVEPEAHGRGIGRLLVADAADRARAAGAPSLDVVSGPESQPFYERVGFVAVAPSPTRFGPATCLRLTL